MTTKAATRFKMRGLAGIALMAFGIGLAFVFNKASDWPAQAKTIAMAMAYCTGIGGVPLVMSYVERLEFGGMKPPLKPPLKAMAFLLVMLLLLNL